MHTRSVDFIYRIELDKACSQHDMSYGKWKDLAKRTQSDIQNIMFISKD